MASISRFLSLNNKELDNNKKEPESKKVSAKDILVDPEGVFLNSSLKPKNHPDSFETMMSPRLAASLESFKSNQPFLLTINSKKQREEPDKSKESSTLFIFKKKGVRAQNSSENHQPNQHDENAKVNLARVSPTKSLVEEMSRFSMTEISQMSPTLKSSTTKQKAESATSICLGLKNGLGNSPEGKMMRTTPRELGKVEEMTVPATLEGQFSSKSRKEAADLQQNDFNFSMKIAEENEQEEQEEPNSPRSHRLELIEGTLIKEKGDEERNPEPALEGMTPRSAEKANLVCALCCDKPSNAVLMNCGHGGICYECAKEIWKLKDECYLCRAVIPLKVPIEIVAFWV